MGIIFTTKIKKRKCIGRYYQRRMASFLTKTTRTFRKQNNSVCIITDKILTFSQ